MAQSQSIRSYAEFVQMLTEARITHHADPVRQTVDVPPEMHELPGPTHVRWEKDHPFVQFIQPIVVDVPADRVRDVEGAVVRLNNVSMFPGIEFDHRTGTVYYRVTAVVLIDGVRVDLLVAYLRGLVISSGQLRDPFLQVVGGLAGEHVLGVTRMGPAS